MSKSLRSRMGAAVRRSSTLLSISRPGTPSRASSEGDNNSLHRIDTGASSSPPPQSNLSEGRTSLEAPPVHTAEQSHVPSPIAESPAREAAASEEEAASKAPVGPSPLAQSAVTAGSTPPVEDEVAKPESEYVPPSILPSSAAAGPGAFTDEPEDMSTMTNEQKVAEPTAPTAHEPLLAPEADTPVLHKEDDHIEEAIGTDDTPIILPAAEPPLSIVDESKAGSSSYFALPITAERSTTEAPVAIPLDPSPDPERDIHNIHSPMMEEIAADVHENPWGAPRDPATAYMPMPVPAHEGNGRVTRPSSRSSMRQPTQGRLTAKSSRASLAIHTDAPAEEKHVKIVNTPIVVDIGSRAPSTNGDVHTPIRTYVESPTEGRRSRSVSVSSKAPSETAEDPFADPPHMPQAAVMPNPYVAEQPRVLPAESHNDVFGTLVMPLPAVHEVIPNQSTNSLVPSARGHFEHEMDETRPLLSSRAHSPQPLSMAGISPMPVADVSSRNTTHPLLHQFGWIEYILPDSSFYYVHPTLRVTTDIDLRNIQNLDVVNKYLERKDGGSSYGYGTVASNGWEIWLRESGVKSKKKGGKDDFVKCWIDHKRRILTYNSPDGRDGSRIEDEDRLDVEYRYWSFMEAHPAHVTLPPNAKTEAVEVLTWSYTDRLLPRSQGPPPPFSQEECNELTNLLRSFGDNPSDQALQNTVHTRIVSRILLRVAQSRQEYFRPDRPLPQDAAKDGLAKARRKTPFRQALSDFVLSCLCLGIPYFFFNRSQHHRLDEESGIRNGAPIIVVGACTCLVAAIVLSASVTFLSLPGLDSIARVTALVAILCSTTSMAASVVALFRYKADLERPISIAVGGGEGMVALSSRNIIMSLPLVLLVYGVTSFVIGIVLYSFRGFKLTNTSTVAEHFDVYTSWTVVGLLAGLVGVLSTAVVLSRR
ncbi:hypothetical protein PTI98_005621 [Pleurotus ostreatus]|nr:hypothetical protein PTI98_005621 [Pleurotus ostreatus]